MKKLLFIGIVSFIICSCSQEIKFNNEPGFLSQKNDQTWKAQSITAKKTGNSLVIEVTNGLEKIFLNTSSTAVGTYTFGTNNVSNLAIFSQTIDGSNITYTTDVISGPVKSIESVVNTGENYVAGIANTTSTGAGQGLRVKTNVTLGKVQSVDLVAPGLGYKSGDIITILGGNGNAKILIKDVIFSNGFVKITKNVGGIIEGEFLFTAKKNVYYPLLEDTVTFSKGYFYNLNTN